MEKEKETYIQQLGIGVASLTFGVALSIFIYAAATGVISNLETGFLYVISFLLMLRFWWRYSELFIQFLPSSNFWQFLCDFAISFFGILTVLFVGNIQMWAALGAAAMVASMARCGLSWQDAKDRNIKTSLKRTFIGAIVMFIIMSIIFLLAPLIENFILAATALVIVIFFVVSISWKAELTLSKI